MYYFLKLVSWLPLWVLYGICDFIFVVTFYVVRWRRDIASENIANAFPEKTPRERYEIMRHSYWNLGVTIAESLWASRQSAATIRERITIDNIEEGVDWLKQGKSLLIIAAHFSNWEWMVFSISTRWDCPIVTAYKPQRLSGADRFLKEARSHFGNTLLIPHTEYPKEVAAHRREQRIYALVVDQTPLRKDNKYWGRFLNQDTAFYLGADRLAHILNAPVIYPAIRRVRRGHYAIRFEFLAVPPYRKAAADASPEEKNAVIAAYAQRLETEIRKAPGEWLWIHRKWKYERTPETE